MVICHAQILKYYHRSESLSDMTGENKVEQGRHITVTVCAIAIVLIFGTIFFNENQLAKDLWFSFWMLYIGLVTLMSYYFAEKSLVFQLVNSVLLAASSLTLLKLEPSKRKRIFFYNSMISFLALTSGIIWILGIWIDKNVAANFVVLITLNIWSFGLYKEKLSGKWVIELTLISSFMIIVLMAIEYARYGTLG